MTTITNQDVNVAASQTHAAQDVFQALNKLGIELSEMAVPAAAYVMAQRSGQMLFVSGHIAKKQGAVWAGKLGADLTVEQGKEAARLIAIDLITTLNHYADLNKIRIIKVMSLVNSTPEFTEQHLVTNGCSELLLEVFGQYGVHARSAFGVAQIPLGACVEIELIAEILN
jgi:enamine deaminase RidA (YjgF/YER057c/UK114 family)